MKREIWIVAGLLGVAAAMFGCEQWLPLEQKVKNVQPVAESVATAAAPLAGPAAPFIPTLIHYAFEGILGLLAINRMLVAKNRGDGLAAIYKPGEVDQAITDAKAGNAHPAALAAISKAIA